MNNVNLIGRMTKDPELRRTSSGKAVTKFTLAIDRGFSTKDGQTADFIPVVVWNKIAESIAQYCKKGSLVAVEGSIQNRKYDGQDGKPVYVFEVLASRIQFLETKKKEQNVTQTPVTEQTISEIQNEETTDLSDIGSMDFSDLPW